MHRCHCRRVAGVRGISLFPVEQGEAEGQSLPQGDYAGIADGAVLRDIRHLSGTCREGAHSQKPQGRFVRALHPVRVRVLQRGEERVLLRRQDVPYAQAPLYRGERGERKDRGRVD